MEAAENSWYKEMHYLQGVKVQKLTTLKTQNSYRKIPFIGQVEDMLGSEMDKFKEVMDI